MTNHRMKSFVTKMHRSTRAVYVSNTYMYNKKITETMNSSGRSLDTYHLGMNDEYSVNENIKHLFIECYSVTMKHSIIAYICQQVANVDGQVIIFCTVSFVCFFLLFFIFFLFQVLYKVLIIFFPTESLTDALNCGSINKIQSGYTQWGLGIYPTPSSDEHVQGW